MGWGDSYRIGETQVINILYNPRVRGEADSDGRVEPGGARVNCLLRSHFELP